MGFYPVLYGILRRSLQIIKVMGNRGVVAALTLCLRERRPAMWRARFVSELPYPCVPAMHKYSDYSICSCRRADFGAEVRS
jgi:hypothetical protein